MNPDTNPTRTWTRTGTRTGRVRFVFWFVSGSRLGLYLIRVCLCLDYLRFVSGSRKYCSLKLDMLYLIALSICLFYYKGT